MGNSKKRNQAGAVTTSVNTPSAETVNNEGPRSEKSDQSAKRCSEPIAEATCRNDTSEKDSKPLKTDPKPPVALEKPPRSRVESTSTVDTAASSILLEEDLTLALVSRPITPQQQKDSKQNRNQHRPKAHSSHGS